LVPCNRFLLFYNHPIWTNGRLIKTSSIEQRVFQLRQPMVSLYSRSSPDGVT
jgi:hypothetical protein